MKPSLFLVPGVVAVALAACGDSIDPLTFPEVDASSEGGVLKLDASADVKPDTFPADAFPADATPDVKPVVDAGPDAPDAGSCATAGCAVDANCTQASGEEPVCACKSGFTGDGKTCAQINDCVGDPCQNGGTCADGTGTYTCSCVAGYSGTNCETDVNDCASNPCVNGGTCNDLVNDYSCTCVAGYDGKTCNNDINDCASNPCVNAGVCSDLVNDYSCACVPGYDGKTCDNNIDDCASNPCQNGSSCNDLVNDYSCSCLVGYDGKTCGNDINDCASAPCENGGICSDLVNAYSCACAANYSGPTCSILSSSSCFLNLDEGTGTTTADSTGNGHDGTLVSSPTWVAGKNGSGLLFTSGSNRVQTGGLTSLATSNTPFTFAFWMNANTNSGVLAHVSSNADGGGWCTPYIGFDGAGNLLAQAFYDVTPSTYYTVKTPAPLATGAWTHVAASWSAANGLRLYVNGVLISTDASFNYNGAGGSNINWGSKNNQGCWAGSIVGNGFDGTLDEMGYFDQELTVAQIQALMN